MSDPLVLLTPLIILAIVSLLVFVGCGLSTGGATSLHPDTPATLHIANHADIAAGLEELNVEFEFWPGEPDYWGVQDWDDTFPAAQITPDQVITSGTIVKLNMAGTVKCRCTITFLEVPGGIDTYQPIDSVAESQEKEADAEPVPFTLARDGDKFSLTVD
jgi:hypothetical protein